MSNTFAWFRKNEKLAFAVLTLVAIIAFVASDFFLSWSRRSDRDAGGSTTLVKYDGRTISVDEFRDLMTAHHAAYQFTNRVAQLGVNSRTMTPRAFAPVQLANEERFAQFLFFSDQAKRLGIDFNNDEVTNYLRDLSNDAPLSDIAKARDEVIRDGRVITEEKLFDAIRADLRRQEFILLTSSGFLSANGQRAGGVVPGEEWENYKRIYRRLSIEAIPFKVADFEGEVKGEPTEKELTEIYEKGKEYLAGNPYTPVPGMVVDRKLAFQFVKLDQEKILKEEMAKITDEQVRKTYDQRVEKKDPSVTEIVPIDQSSKPEEGTDEPKTDSGAEGTKPAGEDASGDKPAIEEPKGDQPSENKEENENKEDTSAEPSDTKPATEEGKQSSGLKKQVEYFTGLQDEPTQEKQTEEKPAEEQPAENPPAQDEPAKTETTPENPDADKKAATETETTPSTENDPTVQRPKKPLPKTETRIRPYDEVSEALRKELASPAAEIRQRKILDAIQAALDAFQKAHKNWEGDVKKADPNKVEKEPAIDDFLNPVLKDLMLESEAYAPKDQFEIDETELGSIRWSDGQSMQRFSGLYRFPRMTEPYKCTGIEGAKPNYYIFWITKDEPRKLLERKDAEERLKSAWRKNQAYTLAVEAAKDLAKKAAEAIEKKTADNEKNLASAFAEKPPHAGDIFTTKAFSYYDMDNNLPFGSGAQVSLSEIPEVKFAGEDFMKEVFALKLGQTGVAHDAGENHVYVIRIASEGPPSDQLRDEFIERSPDFFVGAVSRTQANRSFTEWIDEMIKRRNFDAMPLRRGEE